MKYNNLKLYKAKNSNDLHFCRLQQLYEFEFSKFTGYDLNKDALYDKKELQKYWSSFGAEIFILYYEEIPIGFSVVNLASMLDNNPQVRDIAEFFVMPNYRSCGYGEWMASAIFVKYPYAWEIRQLDGLENARAFWNKIIHNITVGNYTEERFLEEDGSKGYVQKFSLPTMDR